MGDNHAENNGSERGADSEQSEEPPFLVGAEIVVTRNEPAECTLYPLGGSGFKLMTTWITAREGSFVALEDWR